MKKIIVVVGILGAFALVGAGCRGNKNIVENPMRAVDASLRLRAVYPETWMQAKLNTLYKDPYQPSGLNYVLGGVHWVFGPKDEKNELSVRVHVIAIPDAYRQLYEAHKVPDDARYAMQAGAYRIYTTLVKPDDPDARKMIETLQYEQ